MGRASSIPPGHSGPDDVLRAPPTYSNASSTIPPAGRPALGRVPFLAPRVRTRGQPIVMTWPRAVHPAGSRTVPRTASWGRASRNRWPPRRPARPSGSGGSGGHGDRFRRGRCHPVHAPGGRRGQEHADSDAVPGGGECNLGNGAVYDRDQYADADD